MTRPLRRLHFVAWCSLMILLFAMTAAGLRARRTTTPINQAIHWEMVQ